MAIDPTLSFLYVIFGQGLLTGPSTGQMLAKRMFPASNHLQITFLYFGKMP